MDEYFDVIYDWKGNWTSVGLSVIISLKGMKLIFHAPNAVLVILLRLEGVLTS